MLNINEKMYKPKIKMNENDDTIKKKKKALWHVRRELVAFDGFSLLGSINAEIKTREEMEMRGIDPVPLAC